VVFCFKSSKNVHKLANLGPFAKFWQAIMSFVMPFRPSIRMEQLHCHQKNFYEILCFVFILKSVERIVFWLKSDKK